MNIYTVSLFGHREVPDFKSVENLLLSELYRFYDSVYIPEEISNNIYPKRAITVRNRIMIDQSDEIIFYVNKNKGGAYMTYKYAIKCGKRFVNIAK